MQPHHCAEMYTYIINISKTLMRHFKNLLFAPFLFFLFLLVLSWFFWGPIQARFKRNKRPRRNVWKINKNQSKHRSIKYSWLWLFKIFSIENNYWVKKHYGKKRYYHAKIKQMQEDIINSISMKKNSKKYLVFSY